MTGRIAVFAALSDVYGHDAAKATERYRGIEELFVRRFGSLPDCYARSPGSSSTVHFLGSPAGLVVGRVNLIGEHVDYEGYAVLPMAIEQDTVVAIRRNGTELVIANVEDSRYPAHVYSPDPDQPVDVASGAWADYFLAAYKGVYEFLKLKGVPAGAPGGLEVLVDGRVPTGSGLSSSSALVCASAMAILSALGLLDQATKAEIAEFTCTCERHSGTESGGMDQAISIMARPGFAKLIEFDPVRGTDVSLPLSATFVVANSLTVSNKAETAAERYNLRVVECRTAAMLLARALGLPEAQIRSMKTLKEVEDTPDLAARAARHPDFAKTPTDTSLSASVARCFLQEGPYTVEEVEALLEFSLRDVFSDSPNGVRVIETALENGVGLQLRKRALHVFAESARVGAFKQICDASNRPAIAVFESTVVQDSEISEAEKLAALGKLMAASHASCRDLYECSCPELEELVEVCNANGAFGSRLTGAGWGGCIVSLIRAADAANFMRSVNEAFYSKRLATGLVTEAEIKTCVFASKPSVGGAVFRL